MVLSWVWIDRESTEVGSVLRTAGVEGSEDEASILDGVLRFAAAPLLVSEIFAAAATNAFEGFEGLGAVFAFLLGGSGCGGVLRLRSSTIASVMSYKI